MDALFIADHVPSRLEELGSDRLPASHDPCDPCWCYFTKTESEVLWMWIGGKLEAKISSSIKMI